MNAEQLEMKCKLDKLSKEFKEAYYTNGTPGQRGLKELEELGDLAHRLYMSFNTKPKISDEVIKRSRMSVEDPKFFNSIHAIEDLLNDLN